MRWSMPGDRSFDCVRGAIVVPAMLVVVVGAIFTSAVSTQHSSRPADGMDISVTVGARAGRGRDGKVVWDQKTRAWIAEDTYSVQYEAQAGSAGISIKPRMKYLSLLLAGGPIQPISYNWEPFTWDFPNLVVELANHDPAPLVLKTAVFRLRRSVLDPTPIPVIIPDTFRSNARHVRLSNEGWGDFAELEAAFNLWPLDVKPSAEQYNAPFTHTMKIGSVLESANVDVSAAFVREGIDLAKLPATDDRAGVRSFSDDSPAFGKFKGGGARLIGQLRFKAKTIDAQVESRTIKFATEVWLYNQFLAGVPPPPSYDYEAKFEVDGSNYVVTVPIAMSVQPGGRGRLSIRIGVAKSSAHDFVLNLRSSGVEIASSPIHMEVLVPRSGANYIQGR